MALAWVAAGLLELCLTLGLQLTEKAEETLQQAYITFHLINLWTVAYDLQETLQGSSTPWLAVAAPALLAPVLRGVYGSEINVPTVFIGKACLAMRRALPLASQVVPVPHKLWPIYQALVNKQQDLPDASCQDLTSFDLIPKYTVIFQTSLLTHISFLCNLEVVHAGVVAALGNQPFLGGGKAPLPSGEVQKLMRVMRLGDIAQCNSRARDTFLLSYALQPLDEVLQQLIELKQTHKQSCASAHGQKASSGNSGSMKAEPSRQVDCVAAANSGSGRGSSSSRRKGRGKGSSSSSISGNGSGSGFRFGGRDTKLRASSSRSSNLKDKSSSSGADLGPAVTGCYNTGVSSRCSNSTREDATGSCMVAGDTHAAALDKDMVIGIDSRWMSIDAASPVDGASDIAAAGSGEMKQPCQPHTQEQQQERQMQQESLAGVVREAQVDWLFFNMAPPDSFHQRLTVDPGKFPNLLDKAMPVLYLQYLIETLLLVWPKPSTPSTASSSSSNDGLQEESSSSGSVAVSRGWPGGTTGSSWDTFGQGTCSEKGCRSAAGDGGGNGGLTSTFEQQPSNSKEDSRDVSDQETCTCYSQHELVGVRGSSSSGKDEASSGGSSSGCGGGSKSDDSSGHSSSSSGIGCGSSGIGCGSSYRISDEVEDLLHHFNPPQARWPWILILAGIFQRASLGDRLNFLEQRQGTLLLQLLYHVLLEDRGLGEQGMEVDAHKGTALFVTKADVDVEECLAAMSGSDVSDVADQLSAQGEMDHVEVHSLVLLVLQCLLYKPLRADRETVEVLQPSRLMMCDCGKGGYCQAGARCNGEDVVLTYMSQSPAMKLLHTKERGCNAVTPELKNDAALSLGVVGLVAMQTATMQGT
jgi:hypothetical protein